MTYSKFHGLKYTVGEFWDLSHTYSCHYNQDVKPCCPSSPTALSAPLLSLPSSVSIPRQSLIWFFHYWIVCIFYNLIKMESYNIYSFLFHLAYSIIMISRFIYTVMCISSSFFLLWSNIPVCRCITTCSFTSWWTFGLISFLAVTEWLWIFT